MTMKRLTKNNLLKLIELKKEYELTKNENILLIINNYIDKVINKSNRYYSFLSDCHFDNETLRYLIY